MGVGQRLQRLVREGAKFLTVGLASTAVAVAVFNFLVHGLPGGMHGVMHDLPLPAYVVANLLGMMVSYRGSRHWAFRRRVTVGVAGGRLAFVLINLLSMTFPLALLGISRYLLGLESQLADNLAANVFGLALGTAFRFFCYRRFIFLSQERLERRRGGPSDPPQLGPRDPEVDQHHP